MDRQEKHAHEFLEYVAKNEKRLKKNLRKNITYNSDIFDDVFQDSIIKVYDSIMNGTVIEDFEKYFFIASKFGYINADNKNKRNIKENNGEIIYNIQHGLGMEVTKGIDDDASRVISNTIDDDGWKEREDRNDKINELFEFISNRLSEVFSPSECDIYLIYYKLKSEKNGVSYQKLAKITNRTFGEISQTIQKIKKFVKNDDKINEIKRKLLNGDS